MSRLEGQGGADMAVRSFALRVKEKEEKIKKKNLKIQQQNVTTTTTVPQNHIITHVS